LVKVYSSLLLQKDMHFLYAKLYMNWDFATSDFD
jgi:hypothetical protein